MGLALWVRPGDGGIVVAVSGEIDLCTAGPLQQVLLRIMGEDGATIFLDLSGVSFMDCAGLRALLTTQRRAESRGGSVRAIAVSAAVRRIADLTGMRDVLVPERSTTDRSATFFFTERTGQGHDVAH